MVRIQNQRQFYNANDNGLVGKITDTVGQLVGTSEYIQETWKSDENKPVYTGEVTGGGTSIDVRVGEKKPIKKILGMPDYVFYPVTAVAIIGLGIGIYYAVNKNKAKK